MKGTLASPAVALASKVLPVPGGPDNTAPWKQKCCLMINNQKNPTIQMFLSHHNPHTFGILAPRSWYCRGFFKKLTNSKISTLASSQPATSWNRTLMLFFIILALDSLMLKGFPRPRPPRPPAIGPCRMENSKKPTSSTVGRTLYRRVLWGKREKLH